MTIWFLLCLQVDTSVFDSREMVQSLAFGLSFLQRMDMKLVVVMGLPPEMEEEDSTKTETQSSLARTTMVKHCQALTEALQHNSANVMPFFSSEALLQLQHAQDESRFTRLFNPLIMLSPVSLTVSVCFSSGPSVVVDSALLQWTLDCRVIPLVCPVGRGAAGRSSVLSPIQVTAAISQSLQPLKVIFLNSSGGIRNQNHKVGRRCEYERKHWKQKAFYYLFYSYVCVLVYATLSGPNASTMIIIFWLLTFLTLWRPACDPRVGKKCLKIVNYVYLKV